MEIYYPYYNAMGDCSSFFFFFFLRKTLCGVPQTLGCFSLGFHSLY